MEHGKKFGISSSVFGDGVKRSPEARLLFLLLLPLPPRLLFPLSCVQLPCQHPDIAVSFAGGCSYRFSACYLAFPRLISAAIAELVADPRTVLTYSVDPSLRPALPQRLSGELYLSSRDAFHARRNHYFLSRYRQLARGASAAIAKAPLFRLARRQRRLQWPPSQKSPVRPRSRRDTGQACCSPPSICSTPTSHGSGIRSDIPAATRQCSADTTYSGPDAFFNRLCTLSSVQSQVCQQRSRYAMQVVRSWQSRMHLSGPCLGWTQERKQSHRSCSQGRGSD